MSDTEIDQVLDLLSGIPSTSWIAFDCLEVKIVAIGDDATTVLKAARRAGTTAIIIKSPMAESRARELAISA